jgi:para-aminobenzoate synthetase / 4-amino-4-deoxychorismate lyase
VVVLQDAREGRWLLFRRPVQVCAAPDQDSVRDVLEELDRKVSSAGLWAVGFVAYQAAPAFDPALVVRASPAIFPLAWFGLYRDAEPISPPPRPVVSAADIPWEPSVHPEHYRAALRKIRRYIRNGDTYQVNYTFRLRAPFSDDVWSLFARMVHGQKGKYGAFVDTADWAVASASPELFFELDGTTLVSRPMKGTVERGVLLRDDLQKADWLRGSEKNRAENVMIVDMVRNDLGRIARVGTVRVPALFQAEKYPTLWQMTSTVCCDTDASIPDIFRALFPASSITGAPKPRTMEIIAETEGTPRDLYTGAIGFIAPGRRAQFNVAIRTVLLDKERGLAEYGVGGGIVWDSEAGNELQECSTKAMIVTRSRPAFALLETMLWTPENGYSLLDRHLDRLAHSAAYFSFPMDMTVIRRRLDALSGELASLPHRIRVLWSEDTDLIVEPHPLDRLPEPFSVDLAKTPVTSSDPFLYHKTTNRWVYDDALAEARGCHDVILWNERREITESTIANVVVERSGRLVTPPVSCGLLQGTYRAHLLDVGRIQEEVILVDELKGCTKIYLINSLRGMWEVSLSRAQTEATGNC